MQKTMSEISHSSFTSDQLDEMENSVNELDLSDIEHDVAPWDIFGIHDNDGQIIVAKKGDKLPLTTSYKKKNPASIPVKFHVNKKLEVVSIPFEPKIKKTIVIGHAHPISLPGQLNRVEQLNIRVNDQFVHDESLSESFKGDTNILTVTEQAGKAGGTSGYVEQGKQFKSHGQFLNDLANEFESKIVGGLEAGLRSQVNEKLAKDIILLPKENNAVVNSLLQNIFDQYGPEKPDKKFSERLAEVLKMKFPSTYRVQSVVQSPLGSLAMHKSKGEGGYRGLAKRIGENFYNRMVRPTMKRPASAVDDESTPPKKRMKKTKGYCLTAEKWTVDAGASKHEKEEALEQNRNWRQV